MVGEEDISMDHERQIVYSMLKQSFIIPFLCFSNAKCFVPAIAWVIKTYLEIYLIKML